MELNKHLGYEEEKVEPLKETSCSKISTKVTEKEILHLTSQISVFNMNEASADEITSGHLSQNKFTSKNVGSEKNVDSEIAKLSVKRINNVTEDKSEEAENLGSEHSTADDVSNGTIESSNEDENTFGEKSKVIESLKHIDMTESEPESISKESESSMEIEKSGLNFSCNSSTDNTTFEKSSDSTYYEVICKRCFTDLIKEEAVKLASEKAAETTVAKLETFSQTDLTPRSEKMLLEDVKPIEDQVSDELVRKIVDQVEFYFSDFSLLKNNFLFKRIRRNKDGFLNVKIISRFRKIRALTEDLGVVIRSLEKSDKLELNADKTKVRRITPIPNIKETSFGKTVVIFNVARQCNNAEELKTLFSKFGPVVHAELMTGSSASFNAYHRRCLYNNQVLYKSYFGVVEFAKFEDAMKAIKDEDSNLPKENRMLVVPLTTQIAKICQKSSPNTGRNVYHEPRSRFDPPAPYNRTYDDRSMKKYYQDTPKSARYPSRDVKTDARSYYPHEPNHLMRNYDVMDGGYSSRYRRAGARSSYHWSGRGGVNNGYHLMAVR